MGAQGRGYRRMAGRRRVMVPYMHAPAADIGGGNIAIDTDCRPACAVVESIDPPPAAGDRARAGCNGQAGAGTVGAVGTVSAILCPDSR